MEEQYSPRGTSATSRPSGNTDQRRRNSPDKNLVLRQNVSKLCSWTELVFKKMQALPDNKLFYGRWLKLVSEYYVDLMNSDGSMETRCLASKTLVLRAIKKSALPEKQVRNIFTTTRVSNYKSLTMKHDYRMKTKYPKISQSEHEALYLRYHILLRGSGHFLSMDTQVYQDLCKSRKLPVLECYASPYNHNLKWYCSLFPEDRVFGAYPRFDEFIDTINFPCTLIANPPYTVNALQQCITKIIKYMKRQNGEFIALLPHMHSFPKMDELLALEGTASAMLQGGTYLLHDFLTEVDIIAPMLLYIIVNVEGSREKSEQLAQNIAYQFRVRAERHLRGMQEE